MHIIIDVQQQFWDFFREFKTQYQEILLACGERSSPLDLIVVGNKLTRIENKSQLNKVRPADDFPNANFAVPIHDILVKFAPHPSIKPRTSSKPSKPTPKVLAITGNYFSPIGYIDIHVLKQNLLKQSIKIHSNFLNVGQEDQEEIKVFLEDLSLYTEGKFFVNETVPDILDSILEKGEANGIS